ncbi:cytochrome P450 [Mycena galopus ATCC 62051]|nr:cytochrome P450 [Mycena galopus ATCC 62051]
MSILLALAVVALCTAFLLRKVGTRESGLPPGPPTLPILGNLHIFPTEFQHYKFTEWARKYGGLYSLKVGPHTVIVLTDAEAVKELMDRRSETTADRPSLHVGDRTTGGLHMVLAHPTQTWKTLRKTAAAILTPQVTTRHLPIQRAEAVQLLHDILHSPQSFYTDIQRYSFSVILSILYGKRAPRYDNHEITTFYNALLEWVQLASPGATPPIDAVPILKCVPERWAKWKRDCKRVRNLQRRLYFGWLDETKKRMRVGGENGSYMEEVLARKDELEMDNELTGYFGGALMEGGSESTATFLQSLVLALIAYPEAQKKAHEEMDRVVGEHRMPTLGDLEHMPYIRALILETHRFRPVGPLAIPHAALAAEEYRGYVIPKGSTIIVNISLYDNPEDFLPDRYLLTENGTKLGVDGSSMRHSFVFGFGRRLCPGIHLARNAININTMNLIWAFNFKPEIDAEGHPVPVDTFAYKQGLGSAPHPFKCRITPRTAEKAKIIECEFLEAAETFSKFEVELGLEDKEFLTKSRA